MKKDILEQLETALYRMRTEDNVKKSDVIKTDKGYEITEHGQEMIDELEIMDCINVIANDRRRSISKKINALVTPDENRGVTEIQDRHGRTIRVKPAQKVKSLDVKALREADPELFDDLYKLYPGTTTRRATIEITGVKEL